MQRGNTMDCERCLQMGVDPAVVHTWRTGVQLVGHENAQHVDMEDYPSVRQAPDVAAREIDRLADAGKIFWYNVEDNPTDLHIAPTTLIIKQSRSRLVHDWTRSGLNQHLVVPASTFQTMDDFISTIRPHGHMAGLDIRD